MIHAQRAAVSMLFVLAFLAASGSMLNSQTQTEPANNADNTKVNTRDRADNSPTADQQKENESDREITRQIRQSLISDKSLSTYAHNVKIITRDGHVTLKGPVRSDGEKQAIQAKATEVAGDNKVTNELEIKPQQQE